VGLAGVIWQRIDILLLAVRFCELLKADCKNRGWPVTLLAHDSREGVRQGEAAACCCLGWLGEEATGEARDATEIDLEEILNWEAVGRACEVCILVRTRSVR
jgi:hypothetical protein